MKNYKFEVIRYTLYLETLNKISKATGKEYKKCLEDLKALRMGLIPIKYMEDWKWKNIKIN